MQIFDVQPAEMQADYCPYCNRRHDLAEMTDEHVIPSSLGGNLKIRACCPCNRKAGYGVDRLVNRDWLLRGIAAQLGVPTSRHDRIKVEILLKNGRTLDAFVSIRSIDRERSIFEFDPLSRQPDGSKWVRAEARNNRTPPHVNVLNQSDVDTFRYLVENPPATMAPGMIKILLGVLYPALGAETLRESAFDILRSCLSGTLHPAIHVVAIPLGQPPRTSPVPMTIGTHTIWAECSGGTHLQAGVSLFGRVTFEFFVSPFKTKSFGRFTQIPVLTETLAPRTTP